MISATRVIDDMQHKIIDEDLHDTVFKFEQEKDAILTLFHDDEQN